MPSKYKKTRLDARVMECTLKEFYKTYLKEEKETENGAGVKGWRSRAIQRALEFYIENHQDVHE